MTGIVEVIDPTVELISDEDLGEITGEQEVVEFEVERAFKAGGSLATVDVVFTDDFNDSNFEKLSEMIDSARSYNNGGEVSSDHTEHPLDMTIDVEVNEPALGENIPGDGGDKAKEQRLFTGHVTRVVEKHDGIVTFEAMDARYYFNKNMVSMELAEEGETVDVLVNQILATDDSGALGFVPNNTYFVDLEEPERISNRSWGIESNITAYEVMDDLRMIQDAWFYIDNYNHVHFRDYPQINHIWGYGDMYSTLAPIIEWESGDEETDENVVVESTYDETGLGPYTWVSEETFEESSISEEVGGGDIHTNQNVYTRAALENERDFLVREQALMQDSGTLRLTGDPRVEPNDRIQLSTEMIGDFSPIATGWYSVKDVRHILDSSEGFITEVDIGKDVQSIYDKLVEDYDSENAANTNQGIEETSGGSGSDIWDTIGSGISSGASITYDFLTGRLLARRYGD